MPNQFSRRAEHSLEEHFGRALMAEENLLLAKVTGELGAGLTDRLISMIVGSHESKNAGHEVSLLRLDQVLRRIGLRRSKTYALVAAGLFPAPIKIAGTRVSAWRSDSVDRWIAEQV